MKPYYSNIEHTSGYLFLFQMCGLYELVIRTPMQTDYGHTFCNDCLQKAMSSGEKMLCLINGEKILSPFSWPS